MLKLVKNELGYLRNIIFGIAVFFIAVSIFMRIFGKGPDHMVLVATAEISFIVVTFALFFIIYLGIEHSEKRVRFLATLPVPVWQTGLYRLVVPVALMLIFQLLILLTFFLLPPEARSALFENANRPYIIFTINVFLSVWLLYTAGFRLVTEYYGRLLLLGIFVAMVIISVIPMFSLPLAENIFELVYYPIMTPAAPLLALVLALGFFALLQVWFVQRRSYLA